MSRKISKIDWPPEKISAFWNNVDIKDGNNCWNWKLSKNNHGYGRVRYKNTMTIASRVAYIIFYGDINSEILVCHYCDNPACCRPDHMFLGTEWDNTNDKIQKGRENYVSGEDQKLSKLTEKDIIKIREMYASGNYIMKDLAEIFGVSDSGIQAIVTGISWKHVGGPITKTELNNRTPRKLKEWEVKEIKELLREKKVPRKEIAKIYNVSKSHINMIGAGNIWRDVE